MQNKKRLVTVVACGLGIVALMGGSLKAWAEKNEAGETEERKVALPAEQVIASIRTAVAAKPGRVLEVDAESENGKTVCDVKILAADGKTYEVGVDVASNKAGTVELDNDEVENEVEDGEDKD